MLLDDFATEDTSGPLCEWLLHKWDGSRRIRRKPLPVGASVFSQEYEVMKVFRIRM